MTNKKDTFTDNFEKRKGRPNGLIYGTKLGIDQWLFRRLGELA